MQLILSQTCICENECWPMLRCVLKPHSTSALSKSCGLVSESSSAVWKRENTQDKRVSLMIFSFILKLHWTTENKNISLNIYKKIWMNHLSFFDAEFTVSLKILEMCVKYLKIRRKFTEHLNTMRLCVKYGQVWKNTEISKFFSLFAIQYGNHICIVILYSDSTETIEIIKRQLELVFSD